MKYGKLFFADAADFADDADFAADADFKKYGILADSFSLWIRNFYSVYCLYYTVYVTVCILCILYSVYCIILCLSCCVYYTVYSILCIKNTNFHHFEVFTKNAHDYIVYITVCILYSVYYIVYIILYIIYYLVCMSPYPHHSGGRGVLRFIDQIIRLIDGNAKLWKSNL